MNEFKLSTDKFLDKLLDRLLGEIMRPPEQQAMLWAEHRGWSRKRARHYMRQCKRSGDWPQNRPGICFIRAKLREEGFAARILSPT